MTDPSTTVRLENTRKDLERIRQLRQSDAFNLYYVRRLTGKRELLMKQFLLDGPDKVDAVAREALRHKILLLDEILAMPETDEGSARKELGGAAVIDPR